MSGREFLSAMLTVVIGAVTIVVLTSFMASEAVKGKPAASPPAQAQRVHGNHGTPYAVEFTLVDGTRCVAVREGGVTCNWSTP